MEVVNDSPKMLWLPVGVSETLYVGQLVKCINEGAFGLDRAVGNVDFIHRGMTASIDVDGASSSINNTLYGVVVGTNAKTPTFSTRTNSESITYASPNAATAETYAMTEGPWSKGDMVAMVKVALICPDTVLRSRLYQSSSVIGTALTVGTVTATSSGTATVHSALGITGQASHSTVYFRSGTPAGQYRVADVNASTSSEWDIPLRLPSSGDTYSGATLVRATLRPNGFSRMQISTDGTWIDSGHVGTTANNGFFAINVHSLDLSTAGNEYVDFTFDPTHLSAVGASS